MFTDLFVFMLKYSTCIICEREQSLFLMPVTSLGTNYFLSRMPFLAHQFYRRSVPTDIKPCLQSIAEDTSLSLF
jgi:hypothetical protein